MENVQLTGQSAPPTEAPGLHNVQTTAQMLAQANKEARAIEVYAQQAQNFEAERKACEIRIRAERRAGELLIEMKSNGERHSGKGNNPPKLESPKATSTMPAPPPPKLSDLGISKNQSSKWQQLANVPEASASTASQIKVEPRDIKYREECREYLAQDPAPDINKQKTNTLASRKKGKTRSVLAEEAGEVGRKCTHGRTNGRANC